MDKINYIDCEAAVVPVRDAMDVLSGKWKFPILISVSSGNTRFREILRSIPKITSKVLAKELRDLEANLLIERTVYTGSPVVVEYRATKYSTSLAGLIDELQKWGRNHRKEIIKKMKEAAKKN
jgi:DNA-binding HxlR family transcriptional regulator